MTPTGVIVETLASKQGAGTINVQMVAELGATVIESAARDVPGGYNIHHGAFPTRPGGGAWTLADIDSATFGIKVDVP